MAVSIVQQSRAEAPAPSRPPARRGVATPIALLVAHLVIGVIACLVVEDAPGEHAGALVLGALFSQPLVCAAWAALAPHAVVARLPAAGAACCVMVFAKMAILADFPFLVVDPVLFILFTIGLMGARARWEWRLVLQDAASLGERESSQFSIRYLLVWTAIVAVLAAIGRVVVAKFTSPTGDLAEDAANMTVLVIVFGALMVVTLGAAGCILAPKRRLRAAASVVGASGVVTGFLCALLVTHTIATREPFGEIWVTLIMMALGMGLATVLSALVLRGGGYRITRAASRPFADA